MNGFAPEQSEGQAELDAARQQVGGEIFRFFHGTSWETAQQILREGFKPSQDGCLGQGVYVARRDKAEKFAKQFTRHGGKVGGILEVLVEVKNPKFVQTNHSSWRDEGYDACRADRTTESEHMEWCIADCSQVTVVRIDPIRCDGDMSGVAVPSEDEEIALEKHATDLEAKICDEQKKVNLMRSWIKDIKRKRKVALFIARAEKEKQEKEKREEGERQEKAKNEAEEREQTRKRKESAQKVQTMKRRARGEKMTFCLQNNEEVEAMWCSKSTACVAMGCAGHADAPNAEGCTVMFYDNGSHAWTSGMPKLLHNKLNGRGDRKKPWPVYLAMGSEDRYYLEFEDGASEWSPASTLTAFGEKIHTMTSAIKTVAFGDGDHGHSFCILTQGGGYSMDGVPEAMVQGMNSNKYSKKQVDDVSLGPEGEWFVRWTDGTWKSGGCPTDLDNKLDKLKRTGHGCSVKKVLFGPSQSWFLRYT
jgi:hypothetical protein